MKTFDTEIIDILQDRVKKKLSKHRYKHTVGVRYTAQALAMRYGEDIYKAGIAGVLHDCAKYGTSEKILKKCIDKEISISISEEKNPHLLHAKLGAYYCEHRYEITDQDIISAIRWHTTGKENMTLLEKIIFIADYIEPGRKQIPGLDEIRRVAFEDIDKSVYLCLKNTIEYLQNQQSDQSEDSFDPMTKQAYAYYKNIIEQK